MSNTPNKTCFAEILESNLTTWQAQCWQWDDIPKFGSLVTIKTDSRMLYGIIIDITTGPTDPIRQPVTYQKTEEELQQEQPQIFEFLKTSFQCLNIGYQENNAMFYHIPPQPPKMHSFVYHTTTQQQELCFGSNQFLHMLLASNIPNLNIEELLLTIIKQQATMHLLTKKRLDNFIETFFMINKNNYQQTKLFLTRVCQLLKTTPYDSQQ